jgi:co-chaperonin GroES (HSP10)
VVLLKAPLLIENIMNLLHNNILVTENTERETTTAGGILLTETITSGHKPATVLAVANEYKDTLKARDTVYLDWSKSMPVEVDGLKCAVIDIEHVKMVVAK